MKLHYYQKDILKKLTLSEKPLKFNQLLITGLESEHMNYHLKILKSLGFVNKEENTYSLTNKGKDYVNLLQDDLQTEEKQPKSCVLLTVKRENNKGEEEYLLSKRLRHPYYGKVGRIGGKIRFGESIEDASQRELFEETGLKAESIIIKKIYRKIRKEKGGSTVQDIFFYICLIENPLGNLISNTEFQENFWLTQQEINEREDLFDDYKSEPNSQLTTLPFSENIGIEDGF